MTLTTLETIESLDFEFELPCDEQDDDAAVWKFVMKCCGRTGFWCQAHMNWYDHFLKIPGAYFRDKVCGNSGAVGEDIMMQREKL